MNLTRLVSLILLSALSPVIARADWRFDAQTGAFYDSNLSNSDHDEESDFAWKSDVRATNGLQLSRDVRLNLTGDLGGELWNQFHGFDNIDLGGSAGLRYRFGLGRQAPWVLAENRLAYEFFDEGMRSGWRDDVRVRGGMVITNRLSVEAGYTFDHFVAHDQFFDLQGHNGSARLFFDVTPSLQLSLGYNYRMGDVISYAIPPRPDIIRLADEEQIVETFGTNPRYTAYRLSGSTHSVSVTIGYAVNKYLSALVSYEYRTTSHDPLEYQNHLVEAKMAFAY